MRDTRTRIDFLGEDSEFDEEAFRADTIDNVPRPDSDDPLVHATD
jgi:malate dehydrogenase (quinone)